MQQKTLKKCYIIVQCRVIALRPMTELTGVCRFFSTTSTVRLSFPLPLLHCLGYWFVQVIIDASVSTSMAFSELCRKSFITNFPLPPDDKVSPTLIEVLLSSHTQTSINVQLITLTSVHCQNQPRPCDQMTPSLAVAWDMGVVSPGHTLSLSLTLAYDQVYAIK